MIKTILSHIEEVLMKKIFFSLALGCLLSFSSLLFISCSPEEKIVEKPMIQIGESDLQEKKAAIYKVRENEKGERQYLSLDFSGIAKPSSPDNFIQHFHTPPIRQYKTGTCWCFSTTSMLESELKRLERGDVKLSELYTVYWEFVEKARGFIKAKGDQFLGHGSEHNAVFRQMKKYGAVPASAYTGLLPGQVEHNHGKLFREMKKFLTFCKENEYWDEGKAVSYVKSILDKNLGKPPETVEVDGKTMTPKEYLNNILQLPLDDYVSFMSFKCLPFYTKGEFKVPDNWWHSQDYYNVPLDDFYSAILNALKNGYTVTFGGDTSEPGISSPDDMVIVPTFDILPQLIDQDSREYRFYNRTSTDDHAIHAVGYKEIGNYTWFLIKDSGGGAHRGQFKGYYFYRDDYVKLKMLVATVHKDAVKDLLIKFQ